MSDRKVIRLLEPVRGDVPCTGSQGNWRLVADDLCLCRACDEPAITCYARLSDYGGAAAQRMNASNVKGATRKNAFFFSGTGTAVPVENMPQAM